MFLVNISMHTYRYIGMIRKVNVMNKLQFHPSKVLKLTNVLKYKLIISDEQFDFNVAIEQMQSYIKVR